LWLRALWYVVFDLGVAVFDFAVGLLDFMLAGDLILKEYSMRQLAP
jgi:hypothetical protein